MGKIIDFDSDSKIIGARLREARQRSGMTEEAAAACLGISPEQLREYESGLKIPRDEIKAKIAAAYNIPLAMFFDTGSSPVTLRTTDIVKLSDSLGISCEDLLNSPGIIGGRKNISREQKLEAAAGRSGKTLQEIADVLNMKKETLCIKLNTKMLRICDLFTIKDLLGLSGEEATNIFLD